MFKLFHGYDISAKKGVNSVPQQLSSKGAQVTAD